MCYIWVFCNVKSSPVGGIGCKRKKTFWSPASKKAGHSILIHWYYYCLPNCKVSSLLYLRDVGLTSYSHICFSSQITIIISSKNRDGITSRSNRICKKLRGCLRFNYRYLLFVFSIDVIPVEYAKQELMESLEVK